MALKFISVDEAVSLIKNGDNVGFSGFTSAGTPKVIPVALAKHAEEEHAKGRPFKISIFSGASTGDSVDGALARAKAVDRKTPYQGAKDMRAAINRGEVNYFDLHLSLYPQELRCGFLGKINMAIIEACDVTEDGCIVPTIGVGIFPTLVNLVDIVIVELNSFYPKELRGLHDLNELAHPSDGMKIGIENVRDRIGKPYIQVDPAKIRVVKIHCENEGELFTPADDVTTKIGENVANFFVREMDEGRIPQSFLPIQSGAGNIANAVLAAMGGNEKIPIFDAYTEVIQDSLISLIEKGRVRFASGCGLIVSNAMLRHMYKDLDFFKKRLGLRPVEYTNNPSIVRQLGVIAINTALEVDIFGNVNSTHVLGSKIMNGIGGSGDFTRSAYLSIFVTPSTEKGGKISNFVPQASHIDHTEHSVNIIVSEFGVADLRGKSPRQRANEIIEKCVHPEYKPLLRKYLDSAIQGQTPLDIKNAFAFHKAFMETGDMRNVVWK